MSIQRNECDVEYKIIRGFVKDKKHNPICGAVVILEKIEMNYCNDAFVSEGSLIEFMLTNQFGEYCFAINDTTSYYKVKVFISSQFLSK